MPFPGEDSSDMPYSHIHRGRSQWVRNDQNELIEVITRDELTQAMNRVMKNILRWVVGTGITLTLIGFGAAFRMGSMLEENESSMSQLQSSVSDLRDHGTMPGRALKEVTDSMRFEVRRLGDINDDYRNMILKFYQNQ